MKLSRFYKPLMASLVLSLGLVGCNNSNAGDDNKNKNSNDPGVVNVYTARHYEVDQELFNKFTEETGIKVNVVKGEAEELIERLKREGKSSEADLFITVDGGILANAKNNDVLQQVTSNKILDNVQEKFRDKENYWVGLSTRARVIVYSKDRVSPEQLSTYEDLATDKWKGKVLVRSSTSLYNQSLLASFIELNGEEAAQQWAEGIVKNFARQPDGGDRDQAKAIVAGIGDVAIMNTYYIGLMANSEDEEEVKVAEKLGVFFPNQETNGTHVNISGIGLTKHSKNKDNAIKLIEYMTSKEAQEYLSSKNYEFPVNPNAELPELLKSWGSFKMQDVNFDTLSKFNQKAIEIFNKAEWK